MEDLYKSLARTRVNYEKLHFSNIYSRASTKCGKQSSEPKKKRVRIFPMTFDPPREITQNHGLDHEKAVAVFIDWAKEVIMSKRIGPQLSEMDVAIGLRTSIPQTQPGHTIKEITLD